MRDWLARWVLPSVGSCGVWSYALKQRVVQWDRPGDEAEGRRGKLAILDVAFTSQSGQLTFVEVTVSSAGAGSPAELARRSATPEAHLADTVEAKLRRYPPTDYPSAGFVPFAIGALGRLSPEASGLIASLARDGEDA